MSTPNFIDRNGKIELSADYNGYQGKQLFDLYDYDEKTQEKILNWDTQEDAGKQQSWHGEIVEGDQKDYVVTRYLSELGWSLFTARDVTDMVDSIRANLVKTALIIFLIVGVILIILTRVIKGFNQRIMELIEEREQTFRKVTEQLYENIYELNITENRPEGESTIRYFDRLGVPEGTPFDEALKVVAEKQVREEDREGYINILTPTNVMKEFEKGNTHLCYDFMITEDGEHYFWMRIDANIYYSQEDNCVHMFTYRSNIDSGKRQELSMAQRVEKDGMTGLYNKMSTR